MIINNQLWNFVLNLQKTIANQTLGYFMARIYLFIGESWCGSSKAEIPTTYEQRNGSLRLRLLGLWNKDLLRKFFRRPVSWERSDLSSHYGVRACAWGHLKLEGLSPTCSSPRCVFTSIQILLDAFSDTRSIFLNLVISSFVNIFVNLFILLFHPFFFLSFNNFSLHLPFYHSIFFICLFIFSLCKFSLIYSGLPRVREMSGKNKIFSWSGKSRGNLKKMSGNFGHLINAGNLGCHGNFFHDIIFRLKLPSYT